MALKGANSSRSFFVSSPLSTNLSAATMLQRPFLCPVWKRPAATRILKQSQGRYPYASSPLGLFQRKNLLSSNANQKQKQPNKDGDPSEEWPSEPQTQRRRGGRIPAAPTSLRRVAVEAQRSRDSFLSKTQLREQGFYQTKVSISTI